MEKDIIDIEREINAINPKHPLQSSIILLIPKID